MAYGLYLILQHSDIKRLADVLRTLGHLVVWSTTTDILAKCGSDPVERWTRAASLLLEKTKLLSLYGLSFRILTRGELQREQRAAAVLQCLTAVAVASSSNALCRTVAERILPDRQWLPLLHTWLKNGALVSEAWFCLLSTLFASSAFQSHFGAAYCDTYLDAATQMYTGAGVIRTDRWYFDLSKLFLHSQTVVSELVQRRDFLGKLGKSLLQTCQEDFKRVDPLHLFPARVNRLHFLDSQRYVPCLDDLGLVLDNNGPRNTDRPEAR